MQKSVILLITLLFFQKNFGQTSFVIPDSMKAVGFYTEFDTERDAYFFSVNFGNANFSFNRNIKGRYVFGSLKNSSTTIRNSNGQHIEKNGLLEYVYGVRPVGEWHNIKAYIAIVKDSMQLHYAFYVNDKSASAWKYLGKITTNDTILPKKLELKKFRRKKINVTSLKNTWINYEKKGWLAIDSNLYKIRPVLRPFPNIDSITQMEQDQKILSDSLQQTATAYNGLYYKILNSGTGETVYVTDTVTIYYKGWNFATGKIFDETKDKPATFPLNRLIQGWQIGVPLINVGGKIRLYLPSALAYGIRNVAAEIPPNAILVFDIEVVATKKVNKPIHNE